MSAIKTESEEEFVVKGGNASSGDEISGRIFYSIVIFGILLGYTALYFVATYYVPAFSTPILNTVDKAYDQDSLGGEIAPVVWGTIVMIAGVAFVWIFGYVLFAIVDKLTVKIVILAAHLGIIAILITVGMNLSEAASKKYADVNITFPEWAEARYGISFSDEYVVIEYTPSGRKLIVDENIIVDYKTVENSAKLLIDSETGEELPRLEGVQDNG